MSFPKRPNYSANKIKKAGKTLVHNNSSTPKYRSALAVVNSWRVAHTYPINTFNSYLRKQVRKNVRNHKNAIVAQRLKRLPTIIDKLKRHPNMSLTTMHDIGGIRAIVEEVSEVQDIHLHYINSKNITHKLVKVRDYIENPKKSGYRGVHLIYKYNNTKSNNPIASTYRGMHIEIQLRTHFQHLWATAVETVGIFQQEDYKSSLGKREWLEFFTLISAVFAILEDSKPPPQHINLKITEIINQIIKINKKYGLLDQLEGYSFVVDIVSTKSSGHYTLVVLNYENKTVHTEAYTKDSLLKASERLAFFEKKLSEGASIDAVLVSAGKISKLRRAYPNYFLDMNEFIKKIRILVNEANSL